MRKHIPLTYRRNSVHLTKITRGSLAAALVVALAIPVVITSSASAKPRDWSKMTSASKGGGMGKLVDACQNEGQLNVIALPHDWADLAL
jgi:putative spermidine/putrescine transport system substrate-binding protein